FDVALSSQSPSEVVFYVDDANMSAHGLLGNNSTAPVAAGAGYTLDAPGVAVDLARGYGAEHLCVRNSSDDVYCWGRSDVGQVGAGVGDALTPRFVLGGATSLCAGETHTCAVAGGDAFCWGHDADGQLGVVGTLDQPAPEPVVALPEPVDVVACGARHTCAYQAVPGGKLWCWGFNTTGALGVGDVAWHELPVLVPLTDLVDLSAGIYHTCAVTSAGLVYCWGAADYGQVGNGTTTLDYPSAEQVVGIGG
ncbi:MAG: hypothetical protein IT373_24515, partial [Polyangiaceae bacterium]|nr:hypothetical protein [Polyangiaceae bacterium]